MMAKEMRMNIYDDEDEDKLAQYLAELSGGEGGGRRMAAGDCGTDN